MQFFLIYRMYNRVRQHLSNYTNTFVRVRFREHFWIQQCSRFRPGDYSAILTWPNADVKAHARADYAFHCITITGNYFLESTVWRTELIKTMKFLFKTFTQIIVLGLCKGEKKPSYLPVGSVNSVTLEMVSPLFNCRQNINYY